MIAWDSDKSVVKGAVPNARIDPCEQHGFEIVSPSTNMQEFFACGNERASAWKNARKQPTVAALDEAHRRVVERWSDVRVKQDEIADFLWYVWSEEDGELGSGSDEASAWISAASRLESQPEKIAEPIAVAASLPVSGDEGANSYLPPLGDRSHHFTTEQIMEAVEGPRDAYLSRKIEERLHQMTSGERYTLYRAIKKLILASAPPAEERVTWRVDYASSQWSQFESKKARSESHAKAIFSSEEMDVFEDVRRVKITTVETIVEVRERAK